MRSGAAQEILASKKAAAQCVAAFADMRMRNELDTTAVSNALYGYILAKYRITPEECASRRLDDLAKASLEAMLQRNGGASLEDTAATCDGADSITVKQALLMVALQKDFNVKLNGFEVAFADDIDDLSVLVVKAATADE